MNKVRLDQLVYDKGFADSREKAKAIVMSGNVYINGQKSDKPGFQVSPDCDIDVRLKQLPFVSRGGYKLEKALNVFDVSISNKICIDCGASTGGFTDVLLQHNASKVYSVDVGYGQLAWKLRNDSRVINLERTNIRYISSEDIQELLDIAVCDVSFISIKLIIPPVMHLLKDDADFICLIKPQFEAGRDKVGKKGVVRDKQVHKTVIIDILNSVTDLGMSVVNLDYSPIKGPEGNIEFLLHMVKKQPQHNPTDIFDVDSLVERAHKELET